jgi:hypothetical protein
MKMAPRDVPRCSGEAAEPHGFAAYLAVYIKRDAGVRSLSMR